MVASGFTSAFGLAELCPHVHLARLQPDGLMDDALHDGVSMAPSNSLKCQSFFYYWMQKSVKSSSDLCNDNSPRI